ncbi:muconolactone Delta-isomerase family protein [Cytophaga aurantiaca]|uniref:muconolactone Delta-isomerase family protein n=1 Tax=Cytophaga aurantiaca TaxID=29530 RepID=UPI00036E8E60|nr:muconolactone Delta-isomerase family protein [Cytophaga aurantiaca]
MKRIIVVTTKPVNNTTEADFEALKAKEMAFIESWKASGVLENFYIRAEKNGAVLIFKGLETEEVIKNIEGLPFFPYMKKIEYMIFDKIF